MEVTESGREFLRAWRTERRGQAERFLGVLPAADRAELVRILRLVADAAEPSPGR